MSAAILEGKPHEGVEIGLHPREHFLDPAALETAAPREDDRGGDPPVPGPDLVLRSVAEHGVAAQLLRRGQPRLGELGRVAEVERFEQRPIVGPAEQRPDLFRQELQVAALLLLVGLQRDAPVAFEAVTLWHGVKGLARSPARLPAESTRSARALRRAGGAG